MKNVHYLLVFLLIMPVAFLSCEKQYDGDQQANYYDKVILPDEDYLDDCVVDLWAGQFTDVGEVGVTFNEDGTQMTVVYRIDVPGWCLRETHLDVQYVFENIPTNKKGNPKIGLFQFGESFASSPCVNEWTQVIDLTALEIDDYYEGEAAVYIAAHAVVEYDDGLTYLEETAWGEGPEFGGGNWSMYFQCVYIPCDAWILYGSHLGGGNDVIYAFDMNDMSYSIVYDPGVVIDGSGNYPNGNAYDPDLKRLYFGTSNGRLFYHDLVNGGHYQLASGFGTMACGAWWDGYYYYVQNGTNRLYEVTISGGTATRSQIGTVPTSNGYGDLVFDPANPGVFVASAGGVWYAYDLNTSTSVILTKSGDGGTHHKQLAYGSDGVLYAVQATTGEFYTAEYSWDDATIELSFHWDSGRGVTDLASGPQCQ